MTTVLGITNRGIALIALVAIVVALSVAALAAQNGASGSNGSGQGIDKLLPFAGKTVTTNPSRRR